VIQTRAPQLRGHIHPFYFLVEIVRGAILNCMIVVGNINMKGGGIIIGGKRGEGVGVKVVVEDVVSCLHTSIGVN